MNTLDRYLLANIMQGTLMVLLILGVLLGFIQLIGELEDVGKGSYTLFKAMAYVILNLPKSIYELFPVSVLVGSLLSLGAMASNSELIVIRAAGVSISRIIRSVVQTGLIIALFVVLMSEVLVPPAADKANSIKTQAMHQNLSVGGRHGLWIREGRLYLNVQRVYSDNRLANIEIYEFDLANRLLSITSIRSGRFVNNKWELTGIKRTKLFDDRTEVETAKKETWKALFNPDLFNVVAKAPADMSAIDLFYYIDYLESNSLNATPYQISFWIKFVMPLSCVTMLILTLRFVFGSQRSGTAGQRIMIGMIIGIGFIIANRIMSQTGQVYGLNPFLSATLPFFLMSLAVIFSMRKVH